MLDINFIRQNRDLVKKAVGDKGLQVDIEEIIKLDEERRQLILEVDELRRQRNLAAKEKNIEKGKDIKIQLESWETQLRDAEDRLHHLLLYVPNIPSPDSPVGSDSGSNKEITKWGEKPEFSFPPKDHVELGKKLGIIDFEQGVKVSGFRGYYLKGDGAKLHWALLQFALDKIIQEGFTLFVPPTLVHEETLLGSGHFPFGKEDVYQIANPGKLLTGEDIKNSLFLTGTAEPSLLAYYLDKILSEEQLPVKVCALTHCFRSEVGSYGRDTKGLYRVHEFDKVEQVVICQNSLEVAEQWFDNMQKISESILQELGLPYRVIQVSTGDMGAGKFRMNDLETWMPGRGDYGETHSNSSLTDWQAKRLNLKFRTKEGKTQYCFTLNNTVLASPRTLIAFLENYQQQDGSVKIPEVLQKYTGFSQITAK